MIVAPCSSPPARPTSSCGHTPGTATSSPSIRVTITGQVTPGTANARSAPSATSSSVHTRTRSAITPPPRPPGARSPPSGRPPLARIEAAAHAVAHQVRAGDDPGDREAGDQRVDPDPLGVPQEVARLLEHRSPGVVQLRADAEERQRRLEIG